jgi:uncharacterized repeat protein (TIGR02543 family)
MKKGIIAGLIIVIILLVVGYASNTGNVILTNNVNLNFNENYFNVIFTEVTSDGASGISTDGQEINFTTKAFTNVGDQSILEYKIKNDSSQYDANVLLETISIDENYSGKYRITYEIINDTDEYNLESKHSVTGRIIIELIEAIDSPVRMSFKTKMHLTAIGRTEIGKDTYTVIFDGNGATSGSMANQEIEYDLNTGLIANSYVKTDYTFAGWGLSSASTDISYLNNEEVANITEPGGTITLYAIWVKTTTTYNYNGSYYKYTIPVKGNYKLEVVGSAGGGPGNCNGYAIKDGGKGGSASGEVTLNKGINLYIVPGSKGGLGTSVGYNGGGSNVQAGNNCGGAGGGATHIATNLRGNGQLSNYASYQGEVLIAAGAGGGGALTVTGGIGGANSGKPYTLNGGNATPSSGGAAGTGYSHYSGQTAGTFGKGGNGGSYGVGAGGAGFYGGGGGAHITPTTSGGGGGGSTYINSSLNNQSQTPGTNSSNGYAIITFINGLK